MYNLSIYAFNSTHSLTFHTLILRDSILSVVHLALELGTLITHVLSFNYSSKWTSANVKIISHIDIYIHIYTWEPFAYTYPFSLTFNLLIYIKVTRYTHKNACNSHHSMHIPYYSFNLKIPSNKDTASLLFDEYHSFTIWWNELLSLLLRLQMLFRYFIFITCLKPSRLTSSVIFRNIFE